MFDITETGFISEADLLCILEKGAGSHLSMQKLKTVCLASADDAIEGRLYTRPVSLLPCLLSVGLP